ncbi:DUF5050 domain-containing protein [Neobacillus sp. D3-1R]|uniref:DUF5050 domain-containing protein n=1 Tax=Neobacillus sp. D3-1R TaxID=3445778 RepID=UPI003F9F9A4F
MKKRYGALTIFLFLLLSPISVTKASEHKADPDKVTREANGLVTWYGDWVYYWGRNESEKETKVTNAFFREKLDGSGKEMLSDWGELVWSPEFEIENNSIYYLGYEYSGEKKRFFLKRMDLDGRNKEIVLDHLPVGSFEVEGKWFYQIGYDNTCPDNYKNGVIYRTNLETKRTDVLKKCIYPRLWPITEKGTYVEDDFYPVNSTKPHKSNLKDVWKQIGHKSPVFLEVIRDEVFPDRGNIYYMIWSRQALMQYLVKYNENSKKPTLIKELPRYNPHLRMVNVYRGYAYFESSPFKGHKREIHRVPLTGGEIKKVIDIPNKTSFSIINGNIYFYDENVKVISRIPLPH